MNRRRHPRLDIDHPVLVHHGGQSYTRHRILNYSESGLYLRADDVRLVDALGSGFHPAGRRIRLEVELKDTVHRVEVAVVYVNASGIGVAFAAPVPELIEYLQQYRHHTQGHRASTDSEPTHPPAATGAILERLRHKTLAYLEAEFDGFSSLAKEQLIAAADEWSGDDADLFFAVNILEQRITPIKALFFQGVEKGFSALAERRIETPAKGSRPKQELQLVEKEDFDEWLWLTALAHELDSRLGEASYRLNLACSRLLQHPVKSEWNPFSPIALLSRLREALQDYGMTPGAKRVVCRAFGTAVCRHLHRLYGEILAYLQQEGIESEPSTGYASPPSPRLERGDGLQQPTLQALQHLSSLTRRCGEVESDESDAAQAHAVASRQRVIDMIDTLPLRAGASILGQLERILKQTKDQDYVLDPLTRAAIGASEELVGAVKLDQSLCTRVRDLLDRFEVPFIKEAVNDPAMLENPHHPGRRFLQAVEGLAPYCDARRRAPGDDGARANGLESLIEQVEGGALTGIEQVTRQLEGLQAQRKALFERNRTLAIECFRRNEKLRQAYKLVHASLRELLLGRSVSVALVRLFEYGWANLLIHKAMLYKPASRTWKVYLRVVVVLHKLFDPAKGFISLSPEHARDLLRLIRKGLMDYPVHPQGAERFVLELQRALQDADAARPFIEQRIRIDAACLKRLFVGQVGLEPQEGSRKPVAAHWLETAQAIEVDEWLIHDPSEGDKRLLNLAWCSPETDRCLLVDGNGIRAMEMDRLQLAQQLALRRLSRLEDRHLQVVDRAVQRILRNIYDSVERQISFDELTGLMNRRAFERVLNDLLHEDDGRRFSHVLILMDVDQFGLVNDLCGFEGGDNLLQSITGILQGFLPRDARLARTGDDEFAILLQHSAVEQGYQIAELQRQTIDGLKYNWTSQSIPVSASLGVVAFQDRQRSSGELLQAAASACQIAKQAGRNCTRIYREDDKLFLERKHLIQSVAAVEEALKKDRIVLVAQAIEPLLDERDKSYYEILLRVMDDNGALQGPADFIDAAEQYDLMRSVDRWVVRHFFAVVNERAGQLEAIGGFSINLSGQSIADAEFRHFLIQQIEASPLPRNKLGFEITETAMVKDLQDAVRFIEEIRALGCRFYLDDFGSGYASFSYLKDLPVDFVKIDGIFIRDLLREPTSQTMVRSVTEIAHFMGRRVIAEFVENGETAAALKEIGVDYIQGYHIGRPRPLLETVPKTVTDRACLQIGG